MRLSHWTIVFLFAGAGNLANGLWMLASPASWYRVLPGAVPDFGPLNEHFVRDLGCMFSAFGLLLGVSSFVPRLRFPTVLLLALWYGTHALVHVYDTARGLVGPEHWVLDVPLCYLPAAIFAGMLVLLWRQERPPARGEAPSG